METKIQHGIKNLKATFKEEHPSNMSMKFGSLVYDEICLKQIVDWLGMCTSYRITQKNHLEHHVLMWNT